MTLDTADVVETLAAIDEEAPPALEVADRLADATATDVADAQAAVYDAIDAGVLVEDGTGARGGLRPADPPGTDAQTPEDTGTGDGPPARETDTTPCYRDLYLRAREQSDADQALVPHEDILPVFREAGYAEIVAHDALPYDEWTVWTPDSREDPLYAYTPDLAGDTTAERDRLADLLAEAGVGTERFIDVLDGQKASFDTPNYRDPADDELGGNYGVKGGRADDGGLWLVDIDVDDYDEAKESNPRVEALRGETLAVASAHTTTDRPGHLYVAVDGDAAAIAREVLGRDVDNPAASFGEIRLQEQYVVGPGSEIVCGCSRCSGAGASDHYGRYELANDRPPAVWSADEFRAFLEADPAIEEAPDTGETNADSGGRRSLGGERSVSVGDTDGRLQLAKTVDDYVADALREATNPDDRSDADSKLASAVAPWVGYDRQEIADVLDDHGTSKWADRGDSYRSSVLSWAVSRRTDAYDPVPYWAMVEAAVRDGIVNRDDLVARDSDGGGTYQALPPGTYNTVLMHVEETYDIDTGRDPVETSSGPSAVEYAGVEEDPEQAAQDFLAMLELQD